MQPKVPAGTKEQAGQTEAKVRIPESKRAATSVKHHQPSDPMDQDVKISGLANYTTTTLANNHQYLFLGAAWACIGIAGVAFITALYFARPVIVPILAAIVIGVVIAPMSERLQKLGVKSAYANLALAAAVLLLIAVVYFFASQSLSTLFLDLPHQLQTISDLLSKAIAPLERLQYSLNGGVVKAPVAIDVKSIALYVLAAFSPAIAQVLIFLFALVLFSLDRAFIKRSLVMAFHERENRLEALRFVNKLESDLSRYLTIALMVNSTVAILTTIVLFALGMPGYMLIGASAFVLNFLPFVGPIALKLILVVLGLVAFPTLVQGLLPAIAYSAIVLIESNAVTPYLVGRQFSVRPLVVFVAIVFFKLAMGLSGSSVSCSTGRRRFYIDTELPHRGQLSPARLKELRSPI